jgi:hypothetical protein
LALDFSGDLGDATSGFVSLAVASFDDGDGAVFLDADLRYPFISARTTRRPCRSRHEFFCG